MNELPFRPLSDDEYRALSQAEKIAYLRSAINARKAIDIQIAIRLERLTEQAPKNDET